MRSNADLEFYWTKTTAYQKEVSLSRWAICFQVVRFQVGVLMFSDASGLRVGQRRKSRMQLKAEVQISDSKSFGTCLGFSTLENTGNAIAKRQKDCP